MYYRPRLSMTTHWGIKNRFHIQNTIELGCGATAFVAERIVVAGLRKRCKLCHKTIDHFMYKTHKKTWCTNLGNPETSLLCCAPILYYPIYGIQKNHPLWRFLPTYSQTYNVTRLMADFFIFTDNILLKHWKFFNAHDEVFILSQ